MEEFNLVDRVWICVNRFNICGNFQIVGIITLALVVHYGLQVVQYSDILPASTFLLAVVSAGLLISFIELVTFFYDDDTRFGVRKSLFVSTSSISPKEML